MSSLKDYIMLPKLINAADFFFFMALLELLQRDIDNLFQVIPKGMQLPLSHRLQNCSDDARKFVENLLE